MRLVVTGGGTGGHVFPALEVARFAREQGDEISYFGSLRGQEGGRCGELGVQFEGFPSQPLYSLRTPGGWSALASLLRANAMARKALRQTQPDAVFATGGYSAAPVVGAARSLKIPYVIHEQNSVPGRSNRLFSKQAAFVAITFKAAARYFEGCNVVRTGAPVRAELRAKAAAPRPNRGRPLILIVGGSQGSAFLNEQVPQAAAKLPVERYDWLHVSGKSHYGELSERIEALGLGETYSVKPYLESDAMAQALSEASLAICRAGGTLAELALFGIPSVLVPLPSAAGNHQFHNAEEFVEMGGATLHPQAGSTPDKLAADIRGWLDHPDRMTAASAAVKGFDVPDATERIYQLVLTAARGEV